MPTTIWMLTVVSAAFFNFCVASKSEECDRQSKHWTNETKLNEICEPLRYDKQYCTVDEDKWDCLSRRALMHDFLSCQCHKNSILPSTLSCLYVEVCTFADPDFNCDKNYFCSVKEDIINCTAPGLPHYTNRCRRGLIHCPSTEICTGTNFAKHYENVLQDHCGKDLTDFYGTNVTIYFIDRVLHDNDNYTFAHITALIVTGGDEGNSCIRDGNSSRQTIPSEDWKIVVPVLIVFIGIVVISYGSWRFRQIRIRENKKLDGLLEDTFDRVHNLFSNTTETHGSTHSSDAGVEIPDIISPNCIPPTDKGEQVVKSDDDPQDEKVADVQPEGTFSGLDLANNSCGRLDSYDNPSYAYERLVCPSISSAGSVFSGYSTKDGPQLMEPSEGSHRTASGYSLKNSSSLLASAGQCSSSGFPLLHSGRQSENENLSAIKEGGCVPETLNATLIPRVGHLDKSQTELSSEFNPRLDRPTRDIDNPTYLL